MESGNRHFFALPRYIWSARKLDIPPGEKNFLVTDEFTLPEGVQLLAIYPHAHYVGKGPAGVCEVPGRNAKIFDSHSGVGPELAGGLSL